MVLRKLETVGMSSLSLEKSISVDDVNDYYIWTSVKLNSDKNKNLTNDKIVPLSEKEQI